MKRILFVEEDSRLPRRLSEGLPYIKYLQGVFCLEKTHGESFTYEIHQRNYICKKEPPYLYRRPTEGLCVRSEGLLCIEDVQRVFPVLKTSRGSSVYRTPPVVLSCMEDLQRVLCVWKNSRMPSVYGRPLKGLLYMEEGLLFIEDLQRVFCV